MNQNNKKSIFSEFRNQYSLSKTLRFELDPVGKTLDNMKKSQKYKEGGENEFSTFLNDQSIEDAYQILKPVFDKIHEGFITKSLESDDAKRIDFSEYFVLYIKLIELRKKKANEKDKLKKQEIEEEIEKIYKDSNKSKGKLQIIEDKLRKEFEAIFEKQGKDFKGKTRLLVAENNEEEPEGAEDNDKKKGFRKLLKTKSLYDYLCNLIENNDDQNNNFFETIKNHEGEIISKQKIKSALVEFKGFTTYFSGFELNRLNYYTTKEEKSTAVATRIVSVNFPKFVDNILVFNKRENEYLRAYNEPVAIFKNEYFNICLSQKGIEDYNTQIGNINYQINLYNQAKISEEKDLPKNKKTFKKLSQFKTLHKQIGCGEKGEFIKKIKDDGDLKIKFEEVKNGTISYFEKVNDLISYLKDHESYENIFWSDKAINTISSKYFSGWFTLKKEIWGKRDRKGILKEEEAKTPKAVELKELLEELNKIIDWTVEGKLFKTAIFESGSKARKIKAENINEFNKNREDNELAIKKLEIIESSDSPSKALPEMIFADIQSLENKFNNLSNTVLEISDFNKDENKQKIKNWLDSVLFTNQIIKYWKVKESFGTEGTLDEKLKDILYSENNPTRYYDMVRNYLTKKPQGELNKLKLNFENSVLAKGWSQTKESEYRSIIIVDSKEQKYLAVLDNNHKKIFELSNKELYETDNSDLQKMFFKQIGDIKRQLPRIMFSKVNFVKVGGSPEILKLKKDAGWQVQEIKKDNLTKDDLDRYTNENYFHEVKKDKKGNVSSIKFVNKEKLAKLINWYKQALSKYSDWSDYDFANFSDTDSYKNIAEFYDEVENKAQKLEFLPVNKPILDKYVEDGKIYLFKIKNKDNNFEQNKPKQSNKNLHSIYWNAVFRGEKNKPKLGANAEIFYRPAILEKAKKELKAKDKNGKIIRASKKRFDNEKFIFHCPITLNFGVKSSKLNDEINSKIKDKKELCFLGIDRGEKHLAYYSLVNQDGVILDQGTLNMPFLDQNGNKRSVKAEKYFEEDKPKNETEKWEPRVVDCWDYNDLLEARASNRDLARKNWQTIGTIKELKDGYISQVVRKIVDLAIENNALIVLENLNIGFKRGRQKIEKQVYQKLELALAKKLNFLVDKKVKEGEIGSVTNALQLTPPVKEFGDIEGKSQIGIMLYTKADYTSQTDPVTGWRKSIYLKKGSEEYIKEQILNAFDNFGFDGNDYYFNYKDKNTGKNWTLYSGKNGKSLDRYYRELQSETSEKKWTPKKQDLMERLDKIFSNFDFTKNKSVKNQILDGDEIKLEKYRKEDQNAWESLRFTIDLIQQIRNTGTTERDEDFILSPIRFDKNNNFDSRIYLDKEKNKEEIIDLPVSGDANGAYNIARKGIIMNEHIKKDLSLFIKDEEWDSWLDCKDTWSKWIEKNKLSKKTGF